MSDIKAWGNEETIEELGTTWERFRRAAKDGITTISDVSLRNLFVEMSTLQSQSEMRLAYLENIGDRKKLEVEFSQSRLLATEYTSGPMNKRLVEVQSTDVHQTAVSDYQNALDQIVIQKAVCRATAIAANALSREMSMRLKI